MTYGRITDPAHIPPSGPVDARTREKSDIDFKRFADARKSAEHAKDVAAFANHLGGAIVVGADSEDDKTLLSYPGLKDQTASEVVEIYEKAATACSPPLTVDAVRLVRADGTEVIAVNIDPFPDQIVACPIGAKHGGFVADAWRFPIRRGSLTDFIQPQDLAMHMSHSIRRAYILLHQIAPTGKTSVKVFFKGLPGVPYIGDRGELPFTLAAPERGRNVFTLSSGSWNLAIPVSQFLDAWQAQNSWSVIVAGTITGGKSMGPYEYHPAL